MTTTIKNENQKKSFFIKHNIWLDILYFIVSTILLGFIAKLLGGKMFVMNDFIEPPGVAPKIVFPIAWAIIYISIGVSTFLMWRNKEITEKDRKINLIIFFIHMLFNISWPLFYFRLKLPIIALVVLFFMLISSCIIMYRYFLCDLYAGIVFNIYTLWLIYALYLNLGIVLLNY